MSLIAKYRLPLLLLGMAVLGLVAGMLVPPIVTVYERKDSAKPAEESVHYRLKGIVRRIDREAGKAAIDHEEIPGFMDAMLMTFPVTPKKLLEDVEEGDSIEGSLKVVRKDGTVADYAIDELTVTSFAEPKTLKVDLSGGKAVEAKKPLEPGEPVPDFSMTTAAGKALKLSDLRGKVVVLTFIYTRCPLPDYCPMVDRKFHELAELLEPKPAFREGVRLLSVSFDPEHDTPEALARHASRLGAKPPLWTYAVASHDELAKVADRLGLVYGPMQKQIIHNLSVALIDGEGKLVRLDAGALGKAWDPKAAFKTIAQLMSGRSR